MKVQQYEDTALETIIRGNVDSFFADMAAGSGQTELTKSLRDAREMDDTNHAFAQFELEMQSVACGGRSGPAPRLRSERPESEQEWRVGDDPDLPFEKDGGELHKRHDPGNVLRGEPGSKKISGDWVHEFDAEGRICRAYHKSVNPSMFERLEA